MKPRGVVILAGTLGMLVLYLFLVQLPKSRNARTQAHAGGYLSAGLTESATHVEISRSGVLISLFEEDGYWNVASPFEDRADLSAVMTLLAALDRGIIERNLGPTDTPADYGLDAPIATLVVNNADGPLVHLQVGSTNIDGSLSYAYRNDSPDVLLIPTSVRRYLLRPTQEFRDEKIVYVSTEDVCKLSFRSADADMTWKRDGDTWRLAGSRPAIFGDEYQLLSVIRRLRAMRAVSFRPLADSTTLGLDDPQVVSIVTCAEAHKIEIDFGKEQDDLVPLRVRGESRIAMVDPGGTYIFQPVFFFRDRRMVHIKTAEVARIEFASADTTASVQRTGSGWGFANPAMGSANRDVAEQLLVYLANLKVSRILDDSTDVAMPDRDNFFHLRLLNESGAPIDELRGIPHGTGWQVTSLSSPILGTIGKEDVADIKKRFGQLRQ